MKAKGVMTLKTEGGERKMHYSVIGGKIYTTTDTNTNKVKQIKANNKVKIDLTDKDYIASLYSDTEEADKLLKEYIQTQSGIAKIIGKYVKTKNRTVIVLTEV